MTSLRSLLSLSLQFALAGTILVACGEPNGAPLEPGTGVPPGGAGASGISGGGGLLDGMGGGLNANAAGAAGSATISNLGGAAGAGGAGDMMLPPKPVPPADGCTVYVSADGAGNECTSDVPCSLAGGRDKVRGLNQAMTADIEVCLAPGTYWLSETFSLSQNANVSDSGANGFNIVYRPLNDEAVVLSGGRPITGFEVHDAAKNIYKAAVPGLETRQLFVNGVRAQRARSKDNMGMVRADHGFTANTDVMQSWKNQTDIELSGELDWRHYRCPVESISGNYVRLQSPCWELSQDIPGGWWEFKEVSWVENAYELLDEEGEFYLDASSETLFYKPRAGEDLSTASVVAPVLQTIVEGRGTLGDPLRNIVFSGLTFAHGTWTEPSTNVGYTSWQSGFLHRTLEQYYDSGFYVAPSNLVFEWVDSLTFEGNVFTQLGANGLDLFNAARNNQIIGNRFDDISGRAITLGHIDDYDVPPEQMIKNNVIKNNFIHRSGVEYRDCSIIFIGYTQDTLVEHNWLRYGPYMGVSLGWGWTSHPDSTAGNNIVRWNRIEDFMMHTFDGSGVYALGPQRDSSVDHNYIYRGLPRGEGIFPDQGASYMFWEWNVIEDVGWQWIHDWSSQAHHNTIRHNITNQPNYEHSGGADKMDVFEDNLIVTDGNWPQEALDIKAKSGLEPAYAHLAQP